MAASTAIDFIYLSEQDMIRAGVTDMARCVDTMEEALGLLYQGDYRMAGANNNSHGAQVNFPEESPFETMPKPTADRRFMAMPAYLGGSFQTAGVKWYGSNIANREKDLPRSILMFTLNDADTGAPLAFMSANLLSAYRTGALPGVGARHFAPKDARVVGILGPGVMARTTLQAFKVARPGIDTVKVKGRGQKSLDAFRAWVEETFPDITVVQVDETEDVVRDSDLITFCSSGASGDPAGYPTVKREWVKPGAFLAMPSLCNVDDGMIEPDVRKIVDSRALYEAWAEETPAPHHHVVPMIGVKFMDLIEEGRLAPEDIEDIGGVITGESEGRRSDDEIVIMSIGGLPVEDVAWGTVVYRNAVERGIGVKLNLWDTPALR